MNDERHKASKEKGVKYCQCLINIKYLKIWKEWP